MPSYYELTTYIPGPKTALLAMLEDYKRALERLGLLDEKVIRWLTTIDWEPGEDTFGFSIEKPLDLNVAATSLQVRPVVECWGADSSNEELWYQAGLLFDTERLKASTDWFEQDFHPEAAGVVWHTMRAFSQAFPTRVIYFVHEAWSLDLMSYHRDQEGDLWRFDLALVPQTLFTRFSPLPSTYISHEFPYGWGVVQKEWQPVLPWLAG